MEHSGPSPTSGDSRIAYIIKLAKELTLRTGGIRPYARRLFCVKKKDGRHHLMVLQPVLMHDQVITLDGGSRPLYYPRLLLTKRNTFVRGVLHGRRVYYSTVTANDLTDEEVHKLTRAIRGGAGLNSPEYLHTFPSIPPTKDTS